MKNGNRVITYLAMLVTLVLFFVSLGAMTVNSANRIREIIRHEMSGQIAENAAQYKSVAEGLPEDTTEEDARWSYLNLLRDLGLTEKYSYDVTSTAFFVGAHYQNGEKIGYTYLGGQNMILAQLCDENGTVTKIPVIFEGENTADVVDLFAHLNEFDDRDRSYYNKYMKGFWVGDYFVLEKLAVQRTATKQETCYYEDFGAGKEVQQNAADVTYVTGGGTASKLILLGLEKRHGNSDYFPDYQKQWNKVDMLTNDIQCRKPYWPSDKNDTLEDGLLSVTEMAISAAVNRNSSLGNGRYVNYVYAVRYSPLALALKSLWKNGTILLLMAVYLGMMALLIWLCGAVRKSEIRSYEDEITRQRQALDYARNAEQSRREMTSAIAHELKTPIAVLSSYAEALQENIDAEKQAHYLSVIREEAGKMDRMVLELLDFSRLEAGKYKLKRENFNLEKLAQEVIEPLIPQMEERGLILEWQVDNPMVNADPYRMGQVVENFMTNAIRHTPPNGKIVIRIGTQRETFSVENQGSAIPAGNLNKVWETFWQGDASRNEKGSGLGLAICRTIVTIHGGTCKAENTAAGVRFSVSLEKEKKLFQQGRMPQEAIVDLDFPIAQWYTTVERVMARLGFAQGKALRQEIREGNLHIGANIVRKRREKLYPNYVLLWKEYRISIRLDNKDKNRALIMERFRPGGFGSESYGRSVISNLKR